MSNSTAQELLHKTTEKIQGAYAPSTIRAYRSDFAEFIGFCEKNDREVFLRISRNVTGHFTRT